MTMEPTRWRLLLALAVLAAAVGWAAVKLVDAYANRTLPVPWTMAVAMAMLALALALWARGTRARLSGRTGTKPMDPIVAARTAALALAGSRTGALVAGFYVGVGVALVPDWSVSTVRDRIITSLVTVVCAVLVILAALWLERICRIPPDDDPRDASEPDTL
jgi:uncharacterized membrane protein YoaK (UPF0700 family)